MYDDTSVSINCEIHFLFFSGCSLTFCNPVRTFFTFNPGEKLTNIDVSCPTKFTVEKIESPKPHSLLMIHEEEFFLVETAGATQAQDLIDRITSIQQNAAIGVNIITCFLTSQRMNCFHFF